jgi:hypothetical protein
MSISTPYLPPASARRAIAQAFDLALRRDPIQSLVVPMLLRAPWILTLGLLGPLDAAESPGQVALLGSVALVGDFLALTITSAMLRFRARSVFDAPPDARPEPALDCYARAIRRVPWLVITEFVRYAGAVFGLFFFIVPGVYLGFRLAFAAEAVTLHEPHLSAAFERSFRLSKRRFERWLELSIASVLPVVAVWFVIAGRTLFGSEPVPAWWFTAAWLLFAAWTPIVLYAWTFFYLRLVEIESPGAEVGPAYAAGGAPGSGGTPPMGEIPAAPTALAYAAGGATPLIGEIPPAPRALAYAAGIEPAAGNFPAAPIAGTQAEVAPPGAMSAPGDLPAAPTSPAEPELPSSDSFVTGEEPHRA